LGTCIRALPARRSSWPDTPLVLLIWLGSSMLVLGPLVASAVAVSPHYSTPGKLATAAVAGAVDLAVVLLAWRAWPRKAGLLSWCQAGLAQQADDEPEPRIVRWDDVETVTVTWRELAGEYETSFWLTRCVLRDQAGTEIAVDNAYGGAIPRQLAQAADRILTARLVPPLIRAFEAGEPARLADVSADRSGLTLAPAGHPGESAVIRWQDVRQISQPPAEPPHVIVIDLGHRRSRRISLSDQPNGILAVRLIEHAAASAGLQITRTRLGLTRPEPVPCQNPAQGLACCLAFGARADPFRLPVHGRARSDSAKV
jgi:hypothetical protein